MVQGPIKVKPDGTPFIDCLSATLDWEGGFYNHPADPGGRTMQGVTLARYRQYRRDKGLEPRDVMELERDELIEIYKHYYWDAVAGETLPPGVDLVVFDFGVNSGPSRGVIGLQRALTYLGYPVVDDGVLGPITQDAVRRCDPEKLVRRCIDERIRFVKQIRTFGVFGQGWMNRINDIKKRALKMVAEAKKAPKPEKGEEAPVEEKPITLTDEEMKIAIAEFIAARRKPSAPPKRGWLW